MGKTITKPAVRKDLTRAEELMRTYAQAQANKQALNATIKNELDAYSKTMKEAEAELLQIGERNRAEFDADKNLVFDDGYLHIADSTVVVTTRKFDMAEFHAAHPELIDINLKKGPIKKAFLDKDQRKELMGFGVQTDNEEIMEVIVKPRS